MLTDAMRTEVKSASDPTDVLVHLDTSVTKTKMRQNPTHCRHAEGRTHCHDAVHDSDVNLYRCGFHFLQVPPRSKTIGETIHERLNQGLAEADTVTIPKGTGQRGTSLCRELPSPDGDAFHTFLLILLRS